mgnify:CR=1 FL=1
MKINFKKILSGFLAFLLVVSVVPSNTLTIAADSSETATTEENSDAVAKIGDKEYATLEEAIKAVPKNSTANATTIHLLKDYTIASTMAGHQYVQNIIVDLNGHTLSSSGIALTAYRTGTTLTVQNGTVKGNSSSGTLRATYGGTLLLGENLTVQGAGGGATLVYIDNGTVEIAAKNGVQFVGGKQDFKLSSSANNKLSAPVAIGRTYFATLSDAFSAAKDGDTVVMQQDIALSESVKNDGKTITLDLNGKTITGTDNNTTGNFYLINNHKGNLTIGDNSEEKDGKITLTATTERYWSASSVVVANNLGTVTVMGGTIEHLGGTSMAYGIDNLTNGRNTVATLNVEGGTINSSYFAIRQFANNGVNNLNVTGGVIGYIWMQSPNNNINAVSTVVEGGVVDGVCITGQNADLTLSVKAGCLGESGIYGTMPTGMVLKNTDGVYGIKLAEAMIDTIAYETLGEAFESAENGDIIVLQKNIDQVSTISNSKEITLDLNGFTITGTDNITGSFSLITNKGELTITDSIGNGKMTLKATNNRGWNAYSSVISNTVGGKLIVENGTIEHLGGTDMAYGIDNLTNGKGTYAETIINGGTIKSTYRAIRQFLNGVEAQNILTVNGGIVEGANKSIWMQDPSAKSNTGTLTVAEGATLNGDVYLFVTAGSTEWPVSVSIVASAVNGEVLTGNVPAGYDVTSVDGVYGVQTGAAKIGTAYYETLVDALAAAKDGDAITLINNVDLSDTVLSFSKDITIDFNGCTLTGTFTAKTTAFISVENGANVVLKDSTGKGGLRAVETNGNLSNLVRAQKGGYVTIESGNYYQDASVNGAGMIDTRHNEGVIINGGSFDLGNLGACTNGSPWLLNASGQNTAHVVVNGGSFIADIQHQYYPFEVLMPREKALKKADGVYTVVDAVAYVTEREWSSNWYTNEIGYATLEETIAACQGPQTKVYYKKDYVSEQEVIVLLKDIELAKTVIVANGKSVVLDLNDKKITGNFTGTGNQEMFLVKGNLTVKGGTVEMTVTQNQGWNAMSTIFDVTAGGVLNIEKATIDNLGGTAMNFAVHMNNWGEVTLNANNAILKASYIPVRVFNSGYDMNNVTIENSTLDGGSYCFWVHNYIGDLDSSKHSDDAINARLNLNIYGKGNTFTTTKTHPVLFGFDTYVYFDANGNKVSDMQ